MFFYNWREMIAWVAIFAVALAIILIGIESGGSSGTLRLVVGPKDSFQHRAGEDLKRLIERRTPYQVMLVHSDHSVASQRLLLEKKADAALVAPVALPGTSQLQAVAPVASLFAHVLVGRNTGATSLYDFKTGEITTGTVNADQQALGNSILGTLELAPNETLVLDGTLAAPTGAAMLVTDHFLGPQWPALMSSGAYRLMPLREASAVSLRQPLWVRSQIPAYVYSHAETQVPHESVATLATPLVLAVLTDVDLEMVAELVGVMNSAEGKALAARFDQAASDAAWQLLPKHAAVGGDALPVRELLRQELAWWLQNKLLVLLILAGAALVIMQSLNVRNSKRAGALNALNAEVEGMMHQLLSFEQRARGEHDLRALHQLLDDTNHLKLRGSKLMLGTPLVHDPMFSAFQQQCNCITALLEKRLQGKSSLAAAA